jgi:hypothetical protein
MKTTLRKPPFLIYGLDKEPLEPDLLQNHLQIELKIDSTPPNVIILSVINVKPGFACKSSVINMPGI